MVVIGFEVVGLFQHGVGVKVLEGIDDGQKTLSTALNSASAGWETSLMLSVADMAGW
ncbi:hypothetical protein ACIBEJ_48190 [Nonomuraea sp. NPDC050790]|uniref:hypothetical protein n=1 Tax=Nonomuraea sp. NPDC050790 TaxID=3364371 RepID=UPI0037B80BA4